MMTLKKNILIISALLFASVLSAQLTDFTGYKIFINPGHGGYDSDDRHMLETDFWESEGNLVKGLYLREILQKMKATVFMSRTTNNTSDDLALSSISAMANTANVDFFLAIHSNGFDGKQNQPLMLYRGYDNQPVYPESKVFAGILWQKVYERGNCWTSSSTWVKGDWTFYPNWGTDGLGVLRGLTMPGVLSEGSFHDYVPEGWRLRNPDFLHHESWAFARAFIQYKNVVAPTHGYIAGIVRDPMKSPSWYFKPGTFDEDLPLNGAKITLMPGNLVYNCDNLNNGYFKFDSLAPGTYKIIASGVKDYMKDSVNVAVTANQSTHVNIYLKPDTTLVPVVESMLPVLSDSAVFNQDFTFTFSTHMDRDSVRKAITTSPAVELVYTWNNENTSLNIKPLLKYQPKTSYTITLGTHACSQYKVKMAAPFQVSFVTRNRTYLKLEKTFPSASQSQVSLYPQIWLKFDARPDPAQLSQGVKVLDESGQPVTQLRPVSFEKDGKGYFTCELASPLAVNKVYKITISADLADVTGTKTGKATEITFTTRRSAYTTGTLVEPFEEIGRFWDPEASGSTTGTNNPLTTFTSSSDVRMSGTAGRLDYVFINQEGGLCRVFNTQKPSVGSDNSKHFGMWVFGDMSYNLLEYWFYSGGSTNQISVVDTIDWAGWEFRSIPFTSIGGSGERLYHSLVVRQLVNGVKTGSLWFDEAMMFTPTAIDDTRFSDIAEVQNYPNPFSSSATIVVNVKEPVKLRADVFNASGVHVCTIADIEIFPGHQNLEWSPGAGATGGLYYCVVQLTRSSGLTYKTTRKLVYMK